MSQKRRKCGFSSLGTFAAIGQRTSISLLPHRLEATPQRPLVATYSLQRFESLTRLPNVLRRADTQVTQGEYTNSSHVLVSRRLVYSVAAFAGTHRSPRSSRRFLEQRTSFPWSHRMRGIAKMSVTQSPFTPIIRRHQAPHINCSTRRMYVAFHHTNGVRNLHTQPRA